MTNFSPRFSYAFFLLLLLALCMPINSYSQNDKAKEEILKTGALIRTAFSNGDMEAIKSFHHPDVIKALGYKNVLVGRDAVIKDLSATLGSFTLEFIVNNVESIVIEDNIAIEQTLFSIKGTPKKGGDPFIFSGRTMVTYIRYKESPTGWATIREMIQQATD